MMAAQMSPGPNADCQLPEPWSMGEGTELLPGGRSLKGKVPSHRFHTLSPSRGSLCPSTAGLVSPDPSLMKALSPGPERAPGTLQPPGQLTIHPPAQMDQGPRTCPQQLPPALLSTRSHSQTSPGSLPAKKH